jgi:hypothetical protein
MKIFARFKWPILLAVMGVALNIVAGVSLVRSFRDTGTSFLGPGQATLTITKPGDYTLWQETRTVIDGQFLSFPDDLPSGTTIKVIKLPERTPVPWRKDEGTTMTSGSMRRVSVSALTFSSPGQYQIAVTGLKEKRAFYLDEAKFLRTFLNVLVCVSLGVLFFVAAIGSAIYILIQLEKGRR